MKNFCFKKCIASLAALTCCISPSITTVTTAASAESTYVTLNTSKSGDIITCTVSLNKVVSACSYGIEIKTGSGFEYLGGAASCSKTSEGLIITETEAYKQNHNLKVLATFKLKTTTNLNSTNNKIIVNIDTLNYVYSNGNIGNISVLGMGSTTMTTGYKLGDVNADNKVTSVDATIILSALDRNKIDKALVSVIDKGRLDDWFPLASTASSGDANTDGWISSADSNAILNAYSKIMANTYTGNIGKIYTIAIK